MSEAADSTDDPNRMRDLDSVMAPLVDALVEPVVQPEPTPTLRPDAREDLSSEIKRGSGDRGFGRLQVSGKVEPILRELLPVLPETFPPACGSGKGAPMLPELLTGDGGVVPEMVPDEAPGPAVGAMPPGATVLPGGQSCELVPDCERPGYC
jgi:hypothetical protein